MMDSSNSRRSWTSIKMEYLLDNSEREEKMAAANNGYSRNYHNPNWLCRLPQYDTDASVMIVELVVETNGNTIKFKEFLKQLDEMIHGSAENFGGILNTSDLRDGIHLVPIILEPGRLDKLMTGIAIMPGVERVEDSLVYNGKSGSMDIMAINIPFPLNSRAKNRIRVVLEKSVIREY